jgi:hypothetical protein
MIAMLLPKKAIVHLMLTSKKLNKISSQYLYHTLDLLYHHKALCSSPDALLAFSLQSRTVRDITMSDAFFFQYYRGILALQDLQQAASSSSPFLPSWLPPTNFRTSFVVPFPPMSNLQAFSCAFDRYFRSETCAMSTLYRSGGYLAQICFTVQLSPHLTRLTLHSLPIFCMGDINLLAWTLSGMSQLQELRTSVHSTATVLDHVIPTIFFSLPQAIRIFYLHQELIFPEDEPQATGTALRIIHEPMKRRQEPLLRLTGWHVETVRGIPIDTLRSMIQQCPALEEMEMPKIPVVDDDTRLKLAQFIIDHCTNLHTVMQYDDTHDLQGEMAIFLMDIMPRDTLRAFEFREIVDRSGELGDAILQHADSLTTIIIQYAELTEDTIQTILVNCTALEVFDVETEAGYYSDGEMHLENLVAIPWGSSRLRTLKLIVNIGDMNILRSPIYLRDAPVVLSYEEKEQMSFLESLYEQIGLLSELEHLSLSISAPEVPLEDEDEDDDLINWDRYVFPGMLTLDGDKAKGLPGYLGLLSGLNKLKTLQGFVNVSTRETKATMGWREVEWIKENWPCLEKAAFYSNTSSEVRPCFAWLGEKMPGLDMQSMY